MVPTVATGTLSNKGMRDYFPMLTIMYMGPAVIVNGQCPFLRFRGSALSGFQTAMQENAGTIRDQGWLECHHHHHHSSSWI